MIGSSDEFADLIQLPGQTLTDRIDVEVLGAIVRTLNVTDGVVEADRANKIMRRITAKLADPDGQLTPENIRDLLMPFGVILRAYRGLRIPLIEEASDVDDTPAALAAGERSGTRIDPATGELTLGYA